MGQMQRTESTVHTPPPSVFSSMLSSAKPPTPPTLHHVRGNFLVRPLLFRWEKKLIRQADFRVVRLPELMEIQQPNLWGS